MSVDMFLYLDGIEGESVDNVHAGKIDIYSWSWGGANAGTTHVATGGGAGKASFGNLDVMKNVDKSTPTLWKKMSNGSHIATGTLIIRKAGGDDPLEYLKIEMERILVSSLTESGAQGDTLTESLSLNFGAYKIIYTPQSAEGTAEAEVEHGWDIAKNTST